MATGAEQPQVSVVMSVHNGDAYLDEALDSVLGQTFADLELVAVDDGSADRTGEILTAAAARDPRVVVLTNPTNRGLTASLNRALAATRAPLIARQDADDVSAPERLARQVAFLQTRPQVGLLGTAYHEIDAAGRHLTVRHPPVTDTGIRAQMLFHNALCHSAVVVRRAVLEGAGTPAQGYYDEQLPYSQDVDLWSRLLRHTQAANLRTPLVSLRKHPQNVSQRHAVQQQQIATQISLRQIQTLAPELALSAADVQSLRDWYGGLDAQVPASRLRLCHRYFDLLDALARRPDADPRVVADHRRRHIQTLLGSVSPAQLLGLFQGGVLGRMLTLDPTATARAMGARLLRQARRALHLPGGAP